MTEDIIHLWNGHGRSLCGESCWGKFPSLDVVNTIRLTLYDDKVTCENYRKMLMRKKNYGAEIKIF